ncbi:MAG TPA: protein kinase [Pyrinomonadaceae bacterium]|nr:protein kinase [Pyrinomonadaceae bacterium]
MNASRQQFKELFHAAVELTPHDREAFLIANCASDDELRREVSALLTAHESAGDFIQQPALVDVGLVANDGQANSNAAVSGQQIGSYQILRELGRGGMGAVYLAARVDHSFDKQVALKLIKRGMDSDAIIKRFVMERQILANLDHPNIARLIDGGTTEDGLPYFVLEYIGGTTITRYCDQHKLNTMERLKLFRQVCAAVQFAHQNLIVHRDLKPSNIIVTEDGTPKLLDFGIAKLLNADWSASVEATATIGRVLTPEYASPEQLRGLPITTSSDVYSLGVVLYEVLSGHRPFYFESRLPEDVARLITSSEPMKPSIAIARIETARHTDDAEQISRTPEAISSTRDGNIEKLRRRLAGDLDNILLKALRREPGRRYASVQEFSEDLRRHLEGLPVLARPDTLSYRTGKFITRHKAGVAAAVIVVLTLLSATVITSWQARVARQERAKAERRFKDVRNLTNSFLFDFHDAIADLSGATKAREMVVKKAQEYLDSLAQEAGEDRELLWELSTAYLKLGDVQGRPGFSRTGDTGAALQSYEKSLTTRRRLAGLEPNNAEYQLGLAETLSRFGPLFQVLGKPNAAVEKMREAMEITDRLLPQSQDWPTLLTATRSVNFLGDALAETGNYNEALAMYQKGLSNVEQKRGVLPDKEIRDRLGVSRERLGIIFGIKGEWQKSLDNHLEFLAITEELSSREPTSLDYARGKATAFDSVGDAYRGLKNYPKALENGKRGLAMYEEFLKGDPQNARAKKDVGDCSHHVAETLLASGDYHDALSLLQKTVSIRRGLVALDETNVEYPDDLAESLMLTGESLAASGNFTKAIEVFQEARAISEPIVSSHRQRIDYRRGLARLYTDLGAAFVAVKNQNEAELCYRKGLDLWSELRDQHALWAKEIDMPKEVAEKLARVR